jgi:hypothetical protein
MRFDDTNKATVAALQQPANGRTTASETVDGARSRRLDNSTSTSRGTAAVSRANSDSCAGVTSTIPPSPTVQRYTAPPAVRFNFAL